MPVILSNSPDEELFLTDCMSFGLRLSTIPSPDDETRYVTAQLFDEDDNAICEEGAYEPSSTSDVYIRNLMPLAKSVMSVRVPELGNGTTRVSNSDFEKSFYLKYGERVVDKTTGAVTYSSSDSDSVTLVNASIQDYQDVIMSDNMVLTDKKFVKVYEDSEDWIRLRGLFDVNYTFRFTDGTVESFLDEAVSGCLYPSGPAQVLSNVVSTKRVSSYVLDFGNGVKVEYWLQPVHESANDRIDVYFLEPKGSWSVMCFDVSDSEKVNKDFLTMCRNGECSSNIYHVFSNYGRQILNIRSWVSVSLQKSFKSDGENIEYYRSFANARQYRAAYRFAEGGKVNILCPLILESTEIPVNNSRDFTDMEIDFFYGHDLK